jgi:hypothetical protein
MGEARTKPETGTEGHLETQDRHDKEQRAEIEKHTHTQKGQPAKEVVREAKMGGKLWQ